MIGMKIVAHAACCLIGRETIIRFVACAVAYVELRCASTEVCVICGKPQTFATPWPRGLFHSLCRQRARGVFDNVLSASTSKLRNAVSLV